MRLVIISMLLFLPSLSFGLDYQNMNSADMQEMMQQMQKVQQCMESIDQQQLQSLQNQSEEFKAEIDDLCAQGDRSEAQKKALSFSKKISKNPAMKQMRKCGEMAKDALPNMPQIAGQEDYSNSHVCDQ